MCGIAGLWNSRQEQPVNYIAAMLNAMQHRGPDGNGTLEFNGGAAGMVRLALVDLSERGQQPFWSDDKKVALIFNGEAYNFKEERARLEGKGFRFHSQTDAEVVLNLYLERGFDFVNSLRGMYALAIFDWRESLEDEPPALILVRDPFGIKPLYVAKSENSILFASEIRALLASGLVERQINREALADYLSHGFILQPRTMIENVRMMEAGTIECFYPNNNHERKSFFQFPNYEPRVETLDEAAERLRHVLDESIRLHAFADAPVGAFLSGGIDSGGIVGLMKEHIPHLKTYTLRFVDCPNADESEEAIAAAKFFGCDNTVVDVADKDIVSLLPLFAGQLDQPSIDGLNTWLISRAAAEDVKGVLSGLGGDEWFAGYPVTRRMARYTQSSIGRVESVAGHFAKAVSSSLPSGLMKQKAENLATRRSSLTTWIQGHTVFSESIDDASLEKFKSHLSEKRPRWREETAVGLSCLLDVEIYMMCQLLRDSDATSMAHSLELRVPFVDLEIAKFSRSCRDGFKLNKGGGESLQYQSSGAKRVLIHALKDVLPPETVTRDKKGFALPFNKWMKTVLRDLIQETCNPDAIRKRGLLDEEQCNFAFNQKDATQVLYPQLWAIMILELWCQRVIDVQSNGFSRDFS
jgi:asparagine synthase (glutamine-hydrolysing)